MKENVKENIKENGSRLSEVEATELASHIDEVILIHGSVYKIRRMKGFSFLLLRTKREVVQCVVDGAMELPAEESCVRLTALVAAEERSRTGYELQVQAIEVLSEPAELSPIVINQKLVDTSLENLLDYRPITLRNEKQRAIFKLQEGICRAFREFLFSQCFTEVHTPKIVQAGAEGGANIFSLQYFGQEAYLAQSPQFYKQMMVGVYERVFEIGPVFRAEKHDTARHLNEYTSVDFEMGYIKDFREIMEMENAMLAYTMEYLTQHYQKELELLKLTLPRIGTIPTISFREAKIKIAEQYKRPITDWEDFEPEEEKLLYEMMYKETGSEFVFVTHYPSSKRPFYAMDSAAESCTDAEALSAAGETLHHGQESLSVVDKKLPISGAFVETESFDLLFRGLEITTGGQRIHDYQQQVEKMGARGMNVELFESYLMMHRHGMPPHGGLGLGLERFTARLLGYDNVRLTTLFPRDINRLTP